MPKLFGTRSDPSPPRCPFCRLELARPQEFDDIFYEFDGGACRCGAHFVVDPTARNGGAVLMQAMVQACDGDWDAAAALSPEDYRVAYVHKYNTREHLVTETAFGTIYVVRRRRDPFQQQPQ